MSFGKTSKGGEIDPSRKLFGLLEGNLGRLYPFEMPLEVAGHLDHRSLMEVVWALQGRCRSFMCSSGKPLGVLGLDCKSFAEVAWEAVTFRKFFIL